MMMFIMVLNSKEIFEKAIKSVVNSNEENDIVRIHEKSYEILKKEKEKYYKQEIENLLNSIDIPTEIKIKIEKAFLDRRILKKTFKNVEYSNYIEEIVIKIRQSIQPVSGSIAELCINYLLEKEGLRKKEDYDTRKNHTDFIIYYKDDPNKIHRIEVKNVSLRERGTRGLKFDGDSLAGFFNQTNEFTEENIKLIDSQLYQTGGYCYVPKKTLDHILNKGGKRFKDINSLGRDMKNFNLNGFIPLN